MCKVLIDLEKIIGTRSIQNINELGLRLKQNLQEFIGECECTDDFILMIIATESRGP